MATPWSSSVQCRYFIHGVCREGSSCKYSHDRGSRPSNVCRYYLKGQCTYGDQCRYDHTKGTNKSAAGVPGRRCGSVSLAKSPSQASAPKPLPLQNSSSQEGNLVPLKKGQTPSSARKTTASGKKPEEWIKAKEFVPGRRYEGSIPSSYAKAARAGQPPVEEEKENVGNADLELPPQGIGDLNSLCPFLVQQGQCRFGEKCRYIHGDFCEICNLPVLHPLDQEQQKLHRVECLAIMEKDMEHSFAVQRSQDKVCGICMDVVLEKQPPHQRRFGIMPNCNHCFCLACIRLWRGRKEYDNKLVRSCPECRIQSDFVAPSQYWVDTDEDKKKLIDGYMNVLSSKPCKYFDQGRGECPFNEKCFYLHAYPDGTKAEPKPRRRRRRVDADGEITILSGISLWDFLLERDSHSDVDLSWLEEDLMDLVIDELWGSPFSFSSDSDSDSDLDFWSL